MLKTLNPRQTFTWSPDDSPETVFEYRAYAGPLIPPSEDPDVAMRYIVRQYLSYGIVSVTNISLPIKDAYVDYEKWEGKPGIDWTTVLPADIQTRLWILISKATNLDKAEARDLS